MRTVLKNLVTIISRAETVDPKAVKAYVHVRELWEVGEGAPCGFASLQLAVLEGRSVELRSKIADELHAELSEALAGTGLAASVEVREMNKATYKKSG